MGIAGLVIGAVGTILFMQQKTAVISPIITSIARPLDRYTIPNLQKTAIVPSQIVLDEATATTSAYTRYTFHFQADGKRVTGVAHLPIVLAFDSGNQSIKIDQKIKNKFPVIVQFRGYVDREQYVPGIGTEHSAEVFAENGFISLAPDFLGYGGSDISSQDVFEERFQTYTTVLSLLASVGTLRGADATRVGLWGHSNGGQIALSVLEMVQKSYPSSLWAPVSKPFPYSILYYTDEADDHGKALRKKLAQFESVYDTELYSLTNYLSNIKSSLQIHQGTADDAVPVSWTDEFVDVLKEKSIPVTYFVYPGVDHNLTPGWNTVMQRDIEFFRHAFDI